MENARKRVEEVLIDVNEEVTPHLNDNGLISEGILDSLDIMNLIMKLEREFDIEIDPEDVLSENFESVDKIISLIEKCKTNE